MTVAGTTFDLVVAANRLPVDRVVDADGVSGWRCSPGAGDSHGAGHGRPYRRVGGMRWRARPGTGAVPREGGVFASGGSVAHRHPGVLRVFQQRRPLGDLP